MNFDRRCRRPQGIELAELEAVGQREVIKVLTPSIRHFGRSCLVCFCKKLKLYLMNLRCDVMVGW